MHRTQQVEGKCVRNAVDRLAVRRFFFLLLFDSFFLGVASPGERRGDELGLMMLFLFL